MPSFSGELFAKSWTCSLNVWYLKYEQIVIITAADSRAQTNVLVVAILVALEVGRFTAFQLAGACFLVFTCTVPTLAVYNRVVEHGSEAPINDFPTG